MTNESATLEHQTTQRALLSNSEQLTLSNCTQCLWKWLLCVVRGRTKAQTTAVVQSSHMDLCKSD